MPPRNVALVSLVLLAVALPGWACARLLLAREARALALGGALSVSAHAILGVLFPGALGWPLLAVDLVSGIALLLVSRRAPRFRLKKLELFAFSASVLSVLVLTLIHRAPRGWDSTFHILLVERIAETGALPGTWEPWEPVAVHYTLGLHAIVAHVVRLTGLRPHEAFQGSFPLAYALLLGTFLCASKAATGSSLRAALGTLALGFLALQIRLIYHWGGLPTIVGIGVGLASALALLELPGRRGVAIAGFLLGSLPYLHHLSALVAWTVGLGLVSALWITGKTGDSSRVGAKWLALALGFAVLVALPTVPFALRAAGERGSTSIFHYTD